MKEHRYSEPAMQLEDELVAELEQNAANRKAAAAEKLAEEAERHSGGLDRVVSGKTPLEEVKAIIASKKTKTSAQLIREHAVAEKMANMAAQGQQAVDDFLKEN